MAIKKISWTWKGVSLLALAIPILGIVPIALLNGGGNTRLAGILAGWLTLISLSCGVASILGIFKIKGWGKIVPIFGLLLGLSIAFLAYFTYWFSGYGNVH